MNKLLSVIIPVYYNEESLPKLFERLIGLEKELNLVKTNLEIIFVDDGSGDLSLNELLSFKKVRSTTKIIKLTRNFGVIHATKSALSFVNGDCFIFLSADLQDPPELILEMIKKWKVGSKFTIASRSSRDDPFFSKMNSKIFYWIIRKFIIKDYPAGGFDMALMDKSILPFILTSAKSVYTPFLVFSLGFKPEIIFYHRNKRMHGQSRWTFLKKFNAFIDIILGFSVAPLRLISSFGIFVSFVSFLYAAYVFINALLGNFSIPGFATLVSLISFLLGLVIIMIGIVGEYMWRIFHEINKRPEFVIDEIFE
jgi:glycosyltransferase involved in cell wall biosynthesis